MRNPLPMGLRSNPDSPTYVGRHPKWTLLATLLVAWGASWIVRGWNGDFQKLSPTPVVTAAMAEGGAPAFGSHQPNVTIVVFTDYQCTICKATDPALQRLIDRDDNARVVFKDWPVFGANSEFAARAALAAHRQGKYLAFHRALMSSLVALNPATVERIATGAGVDWPRASRDMATYSDQFDRQLSRQSMQAWSLGLGGTPGYLVGPYLVRGGLDDRALARAVRRARQAPSALVRS